MSDRRTFRWACLLGLVVWGALFTARSEVELRLRIPPAETYVIGDPIPLGWEFRNQTTQSLGFMWEGCCRLNGKLEVAAADGRLPELPQGQALAHMFAKADRLDPGVSKLYETQVGDWVSLPGTGIYDLKGTYRGVLPGQFPQVPRGLALWRTASVSPSVRLEVLSVRDYLQQREDRVRRRQLSVSLSGPSRLVPLEPHVFRVQFTNTALVPQRLQWPDEEALWVLDETGRRSVPAAVIRGAVETLVIPPGGSLEREFTLSSDAFEGEPLGQYRLFVDVAEKGDQQPRVPSNLLHLRWTLEAGQVRELLESAAQGARTGARNAPLKLLRVYLADVASAVSQLRTAGLTASAGALAERLTLAARLRPLHPAPGEVRLEAGLSPSGALRWKTAGVSEAVDPDVLNALPEILDVRRHLGWEVHVSLAPEGETPVAAVAGAARKIDALTASGLPTVALVGMPGTNAPVQVKWPTELPRARAGTLRIGNDQVAWEPLPGLGASGSIQVPADAVNAARAAGPLCLQVSGDEPWTRVQEVLSGIGVPGETWLAQVRRE